MVRLKKEELARLQVLAGYRWQYQLAQAAGLHRQHLAGILAKQDVSGVTLGSIARLCAALSTPAHAVRLEELVEIVPDPVPELKERRRKRPRR